MFYVVDFMMLKVKNFFFLLSLCALYGPHKYERILLKLDMYASDKIYIHFCVGP